MVSAVKSYYSVALTGTSAAYTQHQWKKLALVYSLPLGITTGPRPRKHQLQVYLITFDTNYKSILNSPEIHVFTWYLTRHRVKNRQK